MFLKVLLFSLLRSILASCSVIVLDPFLEVNPSLLKTFKLELIGLKPKWK